MKSNAVRALRRHHLSRLKRKWLAREKARAAGFGPAALPRRAGLRAHTGVPCSCPMCGNPRRHFGEPTVQERRARQAVDGPVESGS